LFSPKLNYWICPIDYELCALVISHAYGLSNWSCSTCLTMLIFFQVVGDRKGAVFGGLVEAPLRPTNKKYQVDTNLLIHIENTFFYVLCWPWSLNRERIVHLFSQINLVILLYSVLQVFPSQIYRWKLFILINCLTIVNIWLFLLACQNIIPCMHLLTLWMLF